MRIENWYARTHARGLRCGRVGHAQAGPMSESFPFRMPGRSDHSRSSEWVHLDDLWARTWARVDGLVW
jgi:hypothetical protein